MREDIGERFGRLTVIDIADPHIQPSGKHMQMRRCLCDCGNEVVVAAQSLNNGRTKSCGCLRSERSIECHTTNQYHDDRLYGIWNAMRQRCNNVNDRNYPNWGGRGITVCDEWNTFDVFYEWAIDHGYTDNTTIDRIDNNGSYCPENCRWTDAKGQANNRRSNRYIDINGEKKTVAQWADVSGISASTIYARLTVYGWSPEEAVFAPVRSQYKRVTTTALPTVC